MELNTEGELNTGDTNENSGVEGMKILDYSALPDGSPLPSEMTFTTGGGVISNGGLAPTDTSTGGGDYFEVDSLADGKFVARIFTPSGEAQTNSFIGVRFRVSDPDNYHILMWQSKDNAIARIGKFVNGSSTYTDINAVIEGTGARPVLLVVANGPSIQGYIGDESQITDIEDPNDPGFTQVADITDTFNQTATKSGMRLGSTRYRVSEFRYASEQGGGTVETPPTALSDGSKTGIAAGSNVTMDFSGSSAVAPATIASYNVTQVSGGAVTLTGSGNSRSYAAPSESFAQDLVFQLIVTDSDGLSSSPVTFTHSILAAAQEPVNQPPTANAGANQSVAAGATVTLDGTGSTDGDGTIVSYAWSQSAGDAVILTGAATARPSFTAPSTNAAQTLTFDLTVTDNEAETATDSVYINVAAEVVQQVESTLTVTYTGMQNKAYDTVVVDIDSDEVIFNQSSVWTNGSHSFTFTGTPTGTNVKVMADDGTFGVLQNEVTQ